MEGGDERSPAEGGLIGGGGADRSLAEGSLNSGEEQPHGYRWGGITCSPDVSTCGVLRNLHARTLHPYRRFLGRGYPKLRCTNSYYIKVFHIVCTVPV